jgi:hypothetical protein
MKRLCNLAIAVAISIGLFFSLPAIAAPDYSSTELPTVESVDIKISTDSGTVRLIADIAVRWRVNEVISLTGYLGIEGYVSNPLSEPCDFIFYGTQNQRGSGSDRQILPSEIIEKSKAGDFNIWKFRFSTDLVDGVSNNGHKFCRGQYSIGALNLTDETKRIKLISKIKYSDKLESRWAQYANLWQQIPSLYPCPEAFSGYAAWRTACDSVDLSGNRFNLTDSTFLEAATILKAKQEADAKAAAELKAKQEAEAKAAAELKAKQEAEAKAAAELKAKQEAEAKASAELKAKQEAEAKAAAELKAKQEAEAKAAAELKAAGEKIISDAKAEAARILAAAKAAAAKKKITITCIKGKLIKKVTAVKPVCPAGYKKKA